MSNENNDNHKTERIDTHDMWCCCCGDASYYAARENRQLRWHPVHQDTERGIGVCHHCMDALSEARIAEAFKASQEENGHDN